MKAPHEYNYWEVNSELLIIPEFDKIYHKDKSKNKQDSSVVLWAVYYAYHPESKYYNLPNKLEILEKNFIKQKDFNWDNYSDLTEVYKSMVLSDSERALVEWGEIMTMRSVAMKKLYKELLDQEIAEIDTKSLKEVDSMLASTPKMFEDYKKIRKDYEEEKTAKKGKRNMSLTDSGEI
jgi:uncharacterized protein YfkK (UPF0435 family)